MFYKIQLILFSFLFLLKNEILFRDVKKISKVKQKDIQT